MTADKWKEQIKQSCLDIDVYKPAFDPVIQILSEILEKRDSVAEVYNGVPIVEHTNSHGETNMMKNPALMLWNDLNTQALAHWRELGLTPSSYKKMTGIQSGVGKKGSALVEALKNL
jgi:phage terminase small subunit